MRRFPRLIVPIAMLLVTWSSVQAQPIPGAPYGYEIPFAPPPLQHNNHGAEGTLVQEARACRNELARNLKTAAEAEDPPDSQYLVRRSIDVIKACERVHHLGMDAFHRVIYNYYWFDNGDTYNLFGPGSWDVAHFIEGDSLAAGKSLGEDDCGAICVGNPINVGAENKFQKEIDYVGQAGGALHFERYYNSRADVQSITMGEGWRHTFSRSIAPMADIAVLVHRDDGAYYGFSANEGSWVADPDVRFRLRKSVVNGEFKGWELDDPDNSLTEKYDTAGRLTRIDRWDGFSTVMSYESGNGPLMAVTDHQGRRIALEYTSDGYLSAMVDPTGARYEYVYSDKLFNHPEVKFPRNRLLIGVKLPTDVHRWYTYDTTDSAFGLLASVIDESGQTSATYRYYGGLPLQTSNANGANSFTVAPFNGGWEVTDSLGLKTKYYFQNILGKPRAVKTSRECPAGIICQGEPAEAHYDENGYPLAISGLGIKDTFYKYSKRGLMLERSERTTNFKFLTTQTDWHDVFDEPIERRHFDLDGAIALKESWTYNARGQGLTASMIDPSSNTTRTIRRHYCEASDVASGACPFVGLLREQDGERTDVNDVIQFTYYQSDDASCSTAGGSCRYRKGDLWKVTNALGHVRETLSYDLAGRTRSIRDPNGVITDIEYGARGWITARKIRGTNNASEADDAITRYEYANTGRLQKVTQPDASWNRFEYDTAQRLVAIHDNVGNQVRYTLDAAGNRVKEEIKNSDGALASSITRVYNSVNWLTTTKDGYDRATTYAYDYLTLDTEPQVKQTIDALGRVTDNKYWDPQSYLSSTQRDTNGVNAVVSFLRDTNGNVTEATDPKNLKTEYQFNAFGEHVKLNSPDTGNSTATHDVAGNILSELDARGQKITYTYDALNRVTSKSFVGAASLNETYIYDSIEAVCATGETFNIGRMTRMVDGSGQTRFCYDRWGNLARKSQIINGKVFTTIFRYGLGGRLASIIYPSGARVDYGRNTLAQPVQVKVTPTSGTPETLVTNVVYYPSSIIGEIEFGDGRRLMRTHNMNLQPSSIEDVGPGGLSVGFTYDEVGNLKEVRKGDLSLPSLRTYRYDGLNRLLEVKDGSSSLTLESYTYDPTGNRTSATRGGSTVSSTYVSGTHRLAKVGEVERTYDASGRTRTIGPAREFVYGADGRLRAAKHSGAVVMNYAYDGSGEQVRRYATATSSEQRYFLYGEDGRLMGEYDSAGKRVQEIVWLKDQPVGLLIGPDATANRLHYVQSDHIGAPRRVIDPVREKAVWSWDISGDAFGNDLPNEDVDGDEIPFVFHMRFPGQVFDPTTGLHHNGYREYDPSVGRYLESDPIGLRGGISTYGYASQRPTIDIDPRGLADFSPILITPNPYDTPPFASTYCEKDTPAILFNFGRWPPELLSCKAIRDCVIEHELSHLKNALDANPNICPKHKGGKWTGGWLHNPRKAITFSNEQRPYGVLSELMVSELYAHAAELRCLAKNLRSGKCDDFCRKQVLKRIEELSDYHLQNVLKGTY